MEAKLADHSYEGSRFVLVHECPDTMVTRGKEAGKNTGEKREGVHIVAPLVCS